jgi:ketosteroid isomerase-like protein
MSEKEYWTKERARAFADEWLPAWTGNDPEKLAAFYTDDVVFLDPVVPAGLQGKEALLAYFRKLLRANPDWVWTQREAVPMEGGFVNLWRAEVPMGEKTLVWNGVCLVWLRDGLIRRNEVYFDRAG